MKCNTPTSFRLRAQISLRCFPYSFLAWMLTRLWKRLSRYYSPNIPNTIGSNLQDSITQQLLSTLCVSSWNHCRFFGFKSCYSCADQSHHFSLCQSADEFDMAEDEKKRNHSETLSVLLYIAHVLPLACNSEEILKSIFLPEDRTKGWKNPPNFHAKFPLNGWNDHIIQPTQAAVLDYYKVRTLYPTYAVLALTPIQSKLIYSLNQRYAEPSDVEEYMRVNNLSSPSFFGCIPSIDFLSKPSILESSNNFLDSLASENSVVHMFCE